MMMMMIIIIIIIRGDYGEDSDDHSPRRSNVTKFFSFWFRLRITLVPIGINLCHTCVALWMKNVPLQFRQCNPLQPLKNTRTSSSNSKAWDGPCWMRIGFDINKQPFPWFHVQGFIWMIEIFLPETAQLSLLGTEGYSRCFLGDLISTTASFPRTQSCRISSKCPSVHHSCDNWTIGRSCQSRAVTAGAPCHRLREDWRLPHKYSNLQWGTVKSPLISSLARFHIVPCHNRRIQWVFVKSNNGIKLNIWSSGILIWLWDSLSYHFPRSPLWVRW